MSVGKISEFVLSSGKSWKTYISRLEQYFLANKIQEELKVATLLTVVGDETYELMADLCSPHAPEERSYEQLVNVVKNHLHPEPSVIAERHKFRQRRQEKEETITQYMGALKNLAKTCDFKDKLDENLRDQFVSGLSSEVIKQRLFSEKVLSYGKAYDIARNMEAAERNVSFMDVTQPVHRIQNGSNFRNRGTSSSRKRATTSQASTSTGSTSSPGYGRFQSQQMMRRNQPAAARGNGGNEKKMADCTVCGRHNHTRGECFYKNSTCDNCGKKGHLKFVCRNRKNYNAERKNFYIDNDNPSESIKENDLYVTDSDTDTSVNLFKVNSNVKSSPIKIDVQIENVKMSMEVDTGSALSLISDKTYSKYFYYLPIHKSKLTLSSYTGDQVDTEGYILVKVKYHANVDQLKLYIVPNGGPSLLGRNWLSALKINIINNIAVKNITILNENTSIKNLIDEYKCIFDNNLGKARGKF